jgi:hypothetical protein
MRMSFGGVRKRGTAAPVVPVARRLPELWPVLPLAFVPAVMHRTSALIVAFVLVG